MTRATASVPTCRVTNGEAPRQRVVYACWPTHRPSRDTYELGRGTGRKSRAHAYTREDIAAEAGVQPRQVAESVRRGRLREWSIYAVVAWIARRQRRALESVGVDVHAMIAGLEKLEALSRRRRGEADQPAPDCAAVEPGATLPVWPPDSTD